MIAGASAVRTPAEPSRHRSTPAPGRPERALTALGFRGSAQRPRPDLVGSWSGGGGIGLLSDAERQRIAELLAEGAPVWKLNLEIHRSRHAIRRAVVKLHQPAKREPVRSSLGLSLAEREEVGRPQRLLSVPARRDHLRRHRCVTEPSRPTQHEHTLLLHLLLYFAAVPSPTYSPRIRKSPSNRESNGSDSPTSCLRRNRSGGLS